MNNTWNSCRIFCSKLKITGGINLRKPRLLKRLAKGYLSSLLKRHAGLRFMDIALTYACNFKCQHCSAIALTNSQVPLLTHAEYKKFAIEAMKAGVLVFHFTGGEPLLRKDLLDIVALFKPQENLISIQTNGWYITEQFLQDYKQIGGDILCVSIDSADPVTHDRFRCQTGSWNQALRALTLAQKVGLQTLMSFTTTHFNINSQDFNDMIRLSKSMHTILSLNLAVPAGKWQGNLDYLLSEDDRIKLNRIIKEYPHVRTDFESNWRVCGCPAFKEKCYLTPYGEVLPCPFIHISFGNIRSLPLSKIRQTALQYPYFQKYHPICIAAEDRNFIHKAGCYNVDYGLLPISYLHSPLCSLNGQRKRIAP